MLKSLLFILFLNIVCCIPAITNGRDQTQLTSLNFYGDTIEIAIDPIVNIRFDSPLSYSSIHDFYTHINSGTYEPLLNSLHHYKAEKQLDDWFYYQLIRTAAQWVSPKGENYNRYTLFKWFLLMKSGYACAIKFENEKLLLYVQSNDDVFNIPCIKKDGKQFVCLNYHDYAAIDFTLEKSTLVELDVMEATTPFSYKVNRLPEFKPGQYSAKDLQFEFYRAEYRFNVMLNNDVKSIFNNYPVVNYETYFNIPLSKITYNSLIPLLQKNIKQLSQKDGIDYLMRFTRYAFAFKTDSENFGAEKRLSPEQTLLYNNSDCEDRAALFFYLVKELYNIPMIVLSYPEHITIAVKFDKPIGNPIQYKGNDYWICEPTPQNKDLRIGQSIPSLRDVPYEVVYAYNPKVLLAK